MEGPCGCRTRRRCSHPTRWASWTGTSPSSPRANRTLAGQAEGAAPRGDAAAATRTGPPGSSRPPSTPAESGSTTAPRPRPPTSRRASTPWTLWTWKPRWVTSPVSSVGSVTTGPRRPAGHRPRTARPPPEGPGHRVRHRRSTDVHDHGLNGSKGTLFLHVTTADLAAGTGGRVEKLGPATLRPVQDWISRVSSFTIRPVLDPARFEPVDEHDPPADARDRDPPRPACVFPGCRIDARACDLDHITPTSRPTRVARRARPPPQSGAALPATSPVKTFTAWPYDASHDGDQRVRPDPYGTRLRDGPGRWTGAFDPTC